jgi:hypothetical protein
MGAIAKVHAPAPTVATAPARDIVSEISRSLPDVPRNVVQHVWTQLVLPITSMFDGGRAMPEDERVMVCSMYVEDLADFEPEAYPIARRMILRERKDRFRMMPAEIRPFLERAERQHYEGGGQVRKLKRLKRELSAALLGTPWDRSRLGPAPGEKRCRIDEGTIASALRERLEEEPDNYDVPDGRFVYKNGALLMYPHMQLRRARLASAGLGLDLLTHPVYSAVLADFNVLLTREGMAKADVEIADWVACRVIELAEMDAKEARAKLARAIASLHEVPSTSRFWKEQEAIVEELRVKSEAADRHLATVAGTAGRAMPADVEPTY